MSTELDEILKEVDGAFHKPPEMYNCAQCVAAVCGHRELCDECKAYGGGHAPGGMCGALYAALMLIPERDRVAAMQKFGREAGATSCHDIKSSTGTPCRKCVALGISLVREKLDK